MAFRVGQKVVCVDDRQNEWRGIQWIVSGGVYEIASISNDGKCDPNRLFGNQDYVTITLAGVNKPGRFASARFRPVVERKTDIAIFTAMLNPSLEDLASHILQEVTLCP